MITNEQLMHAISQEYPEAVHFENVWVGTKLNEDRTPWGDAEIMHWELDEPEPEDIPALVQKHIDTYVDPESVKFSVLDFRDRFTMPEQIAIRQESMTDMEVGLVYDMFQATQFIDVTDPRVEQGIDLYIAKGLIDPERKPQLLEPKQTEPAA